MDDVNGSPAASAQTVAAGSSVTFRGWAGNGHAEPAKGFDLVLKSAQNAYAVALTTGVARADVAKALHSPAMGTSGYDFSAKLSSVVAGTYTVYIVNPLDSSENCDSQRTLSVH
ncbi:MAG TPA: hypothetical protein VF292_02545 [Rhodanobacteraceae bacterium]